MLTFHCGITESIPSVCCKFLKVFRPFDYQSGSPQSDVTEGATEYFNLRGSAISETLENNLTVL
jgi:hypothetical protein